MRIQCKWKWEIEDGGQLQAVNSEIRFSQLAGKMAMASQCCCQNVRDNDMSKVFYDRDWEIKYGDLSSIANIEKHMYRFCKKYSNDIPMQDLARP